MTLPPITDPETKYIITCRDVTPTGTVYKLFWRAKGKGGKKLPRVGQRLTMKGGNFTVVVERIDPPGTPVESPPDGAGVLFIR